MKRKLLVLLIVVLALVIFAPSIVLYTPLREQVLTKVVPPDAARVTVGTLTAGWITPVSATDVSLLDTEGNRLADIGKLTIDRTVIGLLSSQEDYGTIRLEDVTLYALVDASGSNLERALAAATAKPATASGGQITTASSGPSYSVQVVNGRILSRDATNGETWSAESLNATVTKPAVGALSIEATGLVRPAPPEVGGVPAAAGQGSTNAGRFEFKWAEDSTTKTKRLRVVSQDLPVAAIDPWLKRLDAGFRSTGLLTGELNASYPIERYDSLSGETAGRVALRKFAVTGTALQGEQLAIDETNLAWKCAATGGRVTVENLSLASDLAMFDLQGTIDERAVRGVATGEMKPVSLATHGDLQAEGRVDLARLAQRLPQFFQVREGTSITSGQMQFAARSMPQQAGHHVTASLTTTPLVGTTRGQAVEWDTPLMVNIDALYANDQWQFDRLSCESKFLEFAGSGNARQMQLDGQVDLDELTSRLDQFVDLTNWQLAGQGELHVNCQRNASGRFVADSNGKLTDFVIAYLGEQLATEPQLNWEMHAVGVSGPESLRPERLDVAKVTLAAAGDDLQLELTQPAVIEQLWAATDWPVHLTTSGQLTGWSRRLRPWIDLSAWSTAGTIELIAEGRLRISPFVASVATSSVSIQQLQAVSSDWRVNEPRVEWTGDIAWDSQTSTLVSRNGRLVSSTVASSFRDWFWTADPAQTSSVGGLAAVRVNLERLADLQQPEPGEPPGMTPLGEMSGKVKLAAQGEQVMAVVDLTGENIRLQKPQPALPGAPAVLQTIWQEPRLRVVGTVGYSPQADRLSFDGLQTQSQTLAIAASGSVDALSSQKLLNLAGSLDYDLESLSPIMAQYIGEGFKIVGREQARFELKGPLVQLASAQTLADTPQNAMGNVPGVSRTVAISPVSTSTSSSPQWYGRFLAPWQSASLYGLPIGQGRVSAEMQSGQVRIEPFDFAVGGGRFTASPVIALEPSPGRLNLPAGPLLTNIRITPDVSEQMIKYILPVLAGATQTEGVFSLNLTGASVPLGSPDAADVAGQLVVQSIRMVPGPQSAGLVNLIRQVESSISAGNLLAPAPQEPVTLISISDRTIDFRLVDGRVYHQGLEFQVGRWLVRSRGSVGLDETISLVLELQVPQQGTGSKLRELGVTRLEIPASGTLRNPQFDTRGVLQNLGQQLLNDQNIGNALDKLFNRGN
ncbi:hypothetical protein [Aeoliella mucimassa]|nr:hypothetical protein [Aeoliella mucimassa]